MTGLSLTTIGDLSLSHSVHTACKSCGRSLKLDLGLLARRHGRELTLSALKDRLQCSNCGRRMEIVSVLLALPKARS